MIRADCLLLALTLIATQPTEQGQSLTVNVDLVDVYFTVCNRHGRLVSNLRSNDFAIYEDGRPQTISHFSFGADSPITVVLLIDTSGSVRYKLPFEREAAIEFLNSSIRPGIDQVAVFTFDSSIDLRQDFTGDTELIGQVLKRAISGGGTRLYDALCFLLQGPLAQRQGRRAIVLLTDGADNSSRNSAEDAVELARRNNVAIYPVSVNGIQTTWDESEATDAVLGMIATETGGRAFFPKKFRELSAQLRVIGAELRSQYSIGYHSTNPLRDGTYRKIQIDVNNREYSVRSRAGYFAPSMLAATERN